METNRSPLNVKSRAPSRRLASLVLATALALLPGAALAAADVMTPTPKATGAAPATGTRGQPQAADEAPQPSDKMTGRTGQATTAADAHSPSGSDKVQGQAGGTAAPAGSDTTTAGVRPGAASSSTSGANSGPGSNASRSSGRAAAARGTTTAGHNDHPATQAGASHAAKRTPTKSRKSTMHDAGHSTDAAGTSGTASK